MNDHLAVFMLDVGQGDSTVVLLPNGHAVVFDCADDAVLTKLLTHWQVPVIDAFVLSHLDQDHIGGALQFLKNWGDRVRWIALSRDRDISDTHDEAKRAKDLVDVVDEGREERVGRPRRWEVSTNTRYPRSIVEGAGWSIHIIAPEHADILRWEREGSWQQANRHSSVLRITVGGTSMLVGGDAPLGTWSVIPAQERPARVFRVPHHGGALDDGLVPNGWDVARLYREVGAETALVSVGTNNGYGHPREAWIRPITGGTCRMLCTQVTARCHPSLEIANGTSHPPRDPDEIAAQRERVMGRPGFTHWAEPQWRHLTDKRRQVRQGHLEVPCAGTVLVKLYLDGRTEVWPPIRGDHEKLVDTWRRPLCRAATS